MPRFIWSAEYELGIDVIDQQHQRIVDSINRIYDLPAAARQFETIKSLLSDLVDYTLSHFAFEEAMLEEVDYPDFQEHQLSHQHFSQLIHAMKRRCDAGEQVAVELAEFLQHWLIAHIMADDAAYAGLVKQRLLGVDPVRRKSWVQTAVARYFQ